MQDKKQVGREHERAPLDLYINKIVGDEPHLVRVRDISAGGVFLYKLLEPQYRMATEVGLEMKLPNSEDVIWAVGEVVREVNTSSDGLALRFVRIAESDKKLIEDFVADHKSATAAA